MRKRFILVIVYLLSVLFSTNVGATVHKSPKEAGYQIIVNAETAGETSLILNDTHYVPLRTVFEELGALVYYRNSDRQVLALSRDGDMIRHCVGSDTMTVNGEEHTFENSSVLENSQTYIPIEMISAAFCPDWISYESQQLNIQKFFFHNDYHHIIKDVTDAAFEHNFYLENFQRYISYHIKMPSYSMQEILFRVNLGLDYPFYENITTIENPYDLYVLVNKYRQLPKDFTQYNLVHMDREYTSNDGKEYLLAGVAYDSYVKMADAAKADGVSMRVVSAYRTESYQRNLFNSKVRRSGNVYADNYSARPGHSEHQTGLAVDINSTYVSFENSAAYRWLQDHAYEYGFILRYPKGKEWITGYSYEPWHYRFVGIDAATVIRNEGITFEEYYVKYILRNEFK